jgi:hypothetical protein|tara:strand:+ start:336 stop:521 length:186 start_codon:yes stop_codon:yes gene_type:complete
MDINLMKTVLDSGLEGACIVLVLVIAYKIKKARVDVESDCGWCKSSSHNQGANEPQGDENV